MYNKNCDCYILTSIIVINKKTYKTSIGRMRSIINEQIFIGDTITIWSKEENKEERIYQIKKDGEVIVPYKKSTNLGLIFLGVGLLIPIIF